MLSSSIPYIYLNDANSNCEESTLHENGFSAALKMLNKQHFSLYRFFYVISQPSLMFCILPYTISYIIHRKISEAKIKAKERPRQIRVIKEVSQTIVYQKNSESINSTVTVA